MSESTENFIRDPSSFSSRGLEETSIMFFTSLTAQKPWQALELVKWCNPKRSLTWRPIHCCHKIRRQGRSPLAPDADFDRRCRDQNTVLQTEGTARNRPKTLPELWQSKPQQTGGKKCVCRIIHCFCDKAASLRESSMVLSNLDSLAQCPHHSSGLLHHLKRSKFLEMV